MSSRADVIVVGAGTQRRRGQRVAGRARAARDLCRAAAARPTRARAGSTACRARRSSRRASRCPGPTRAMAQPAPFHLVAAADARSCRSTTCSTSTCASSSRGCRRARSRRVPSCAARSACSVATATRLDTSAGPLRARWIVDASGLAGARLLDQPRVAPRRPVRGRAGGPRGHRSRAAAASSSRAQGVPPGEVLGLVGVAGGYSVLNVRLHHGGATIGILTGSIPSLGFPSGKAILDEFVAQHPWVGPRVFGGSGAIPLRRAHDRLADDRVALLGDAGCQVFPAHGSGIGAGLDRRAPARRHARRAAARCATTRSRGSGATVACSRSSTCSGAGTRRSTARRSARR